MKKKAFFNLDNGFGEVLCVALIVIGGVAVTISLVGALLALINLIMR